MVLIEFKNLGMTKNSQINNPMYNIHVHTTHLQGLSIETELLNQD